MNLTITFRDIPASYKKKVALLSKKSGNKKGKISPYVKSLIDKEIELLESQ